MTLTLAERWIISNQLRILEALTPDKPPGNVIEYEKAALTHARNAVENGYEWEYETLIPYISKDPMPEEDSDLVISILEMYSQLELAFDSLGDKTGIEESEIRFNGWDGNNEHRELGFARHFCKDLERFESLGARAYENSHMPTLQRRRIMLKAFQALPKQYDLSKADVERVVSAWRIEKDRLDSAYKARGSS